MRFVELALGGWLVLSAFAWEHTPARMAISILVGLLVVAMSVLARAFDAQLRYVTAGLGALLVVSLAVFSPRSAVTTIDDLCVGFALIASAMTPSRATIGAEAEPRISGIR